MPRQQHHNWETRTYGLGANRDLEDEFLSLEQGTYVDAQNMRPFSMEGDAGALKKINGEIEKFPNVDNKCANPLTTPLAGDWKCILTQEVNDNIIEYWADRSGAENSLIRINGLIVLQSPDFPLVFDKPLQHSKNESCIGGEVYISDFNSPPMIFNVEDLLKNSGQLGGTCSDKYFDGFDVRQFTVNLDKPTDHPVFIELPLIGQTGSSNVGKLTTFGTLGLPVGSYQYAFRFVTAQGDRTQFSVLTPLIPVPKALSTASTQFPSIKTFGAPAAPSVATGRGIKIRFRVVNLQDFVSVEVKRIKYNAETGIGFVPDAELLGTIPIEKDEIQIHEVIDFDGVTTTITDEEDTEVMSAIERAKGIRYFNNRLFLMNVEFGKRDLETEAQNSFLTLNGDNIFPVKENIGQDGHGDTYNSTYFKHYLDGERYGYAANFYDNRGERTFAVPITGADNFQIPNRRKVASSNTIDHSYRGTVQAANTDGSVTQTHEVFDLKNTVNKQDKCSFKNILDDGDKRNGKIGNSHGCPDSGLATNLIGDSCTSTVATCRVRGKNIGYEPYRPTTQNDSDNTGHDYRVNIDVQLKPLPGTDQLASYNPKGFAPNYFATGVAIPGIDISKLPNWVQAFSINRTAPAGRVITQGLGFYKLNAGSTGGTTDTGCTKEADSFFFFQSRHRTGICVKCCCIRHKK